MGFERKVDFSRLRNMRCGKCGHEEKFSHDWIDAWSQGDIGCPSCGITSDHLQRARYTYDFSDFACDRERITELNWYHTSTLKDWPSRNFDPLSVYPKDARENIVINMSGVKLESWLTTQKAKAVHVGTFEAALENMLRRMQDQGDSGSNFYLYRVKLREDSPVSNAVNKEPASIFGDVNLEELGAGRSEIYRYVNSHEDPSSISLALTIDSIASVQRVSIPISPVDSVEVEGIRSVLCEAQKIPPQEIDSFISQAWKRRGLEPEYTNPYRDELKAQVENLANQLPGRIRDIFVSAVTYGALHGKGYALAASYIVGMRDLFLYPERVFQALDNEPMQKIETAADM
jgi:hypothetical protein